MTTITLHQSETRRFGVVSDAEAAQLRIGSGVACISINGAPITLEDGAAGFAFTLSGPDLLLTPRLHPLSIWTQADGEWAHRARHNLHITGGC